MKIHVNKISATFNKSSYNAFIVPKKVVAKLIESTKKFSPNIFTPRNHTIKTSSLRKIEYKLLDVLQNDSGGDSVSNSISREFTANDLINGKYNLFHGWNTKHVDVTVIDHLGKETEVASQATFNNVEIDLIRCFIPTGQKWTLLVEK